MKSLKWLGSWNVRITNVTSSLYIYFIYERETRSLELTLELTHGKKSPMLKIPREAPWVIPLKLMDICKWRDKASITKCLWFQDSLQYCCEMSSPAKHLPVSPQQKQVQHTETPPPQQQSSTECQSVVETAYG